jgi:hypothetical protein
MSTSTTDLARENRRDPAARLRDQAAACRRLSSVSRTVLGASALIGIAEQYEDDARQVDGVQGT